LSSTVISSARRIGWYSGSSAAATMIGNDFVRAAIAVASTIGEGRYPSLDVWCSQMIVLTHPRVSAHSAMSSAAP
jgi:hypothetical protein